MHSNTIPDNPNGLKRLVCIFPHLPMNLKLFGRPAAKDPNNIVIAAQLDPSGGSRKTIDLILDTIDKNIFDLLKKPEAGVPPQIYELILIVEGNGGNTGSGTSIMKELVDELQIRCRYFKLAKTKEEVGKIYREGKIPLLCYTLGTGVTHVAEGVRPLSCDQIRADWNASFLNSKSSTVHSTIGQYLSKKSLEEVMEMMNEITVIPFPLSILSPSSSRKHFTFSPNSTSSENDMSPNYSGYPQIRQASDPGSSSSTSALMSPESPFNLAALPKNTVGSPTAPPSTPEHSGRGLDRAHKNNLSIDTSSGEGMTPTGGSSPDLDFDVGSIPIEPSPVSGQGTFFHKQPDVKTTVETVENKKENVSQKK
jgi:hypothetical protein